MFPTAEKLLYYNIAYGLLYGRIIDEGEDNYEEEDTKDTVTDQHEYQAKARIHHINWLKIEYNTTDGFITARHKPEADLVSEYGTALDTTLAAWDQGDPIYFYKGSHFFVYPAPDSTESGADRLKTSMELYPADLVAGAPSLPENAHYLLAVYAAWMYHKNSGEDALAVGKEKDWKTGVSEMLETMFPRARQAEAIAHIPEDDGSDY